MSEPKTFEVWVGNLNQKTNESDLEKLFEKYGEVKKAKIIKNHGFIEFLSRSDAETAIEKLNLTIFDENKIRVEFKGFSLIFISRRKKAKKIEHQRAIKTRCLLQLREKRALVNK
jgi:RNA recognition motif-containing protein